MLFIEEASPIPRCWRSFQEGRFSKFKELILSVLFVRLFVCVVPSLYAFPVLCCSTLHQSSLFLQLNFSKSEISLISSYFIYGDISDENCWQRRIDVQKKIFHFHNIISGFFLGFFFLWMESNEMKVETPRPPSSFCPQTTDYDSHRHFIQSRGFKKGLLIQAARSPPSSSVFDCFQPSELLGIFASKCALVIIRCNELFIGLAAIGSPLK